VAIAPSPLPGSSSTPCRSRPRDTPALEARRWNRRDEPGFGRSERPHHRPCPGRPSETQDEFSFEQLATFGRECRKAGHESTSAQAHARLRRSRSLRSVRGGARRRLPGRKPLRSGRGRRNRRQFSHSRIGHRAKLTSEIAPSPARQPPMRRARCAVASSRGESTGRAKGISRQSQRSVRRQYSGEAGKGHHELRVSGVLPRASGNLALRASATSR
jgi:hypothetical protein